MSIRSITKHLRPAYALYKSDFRYWFTDEEIEKQNRHNRAFEAPRLEQELVDLYFRKPTEAETGEFVSIARAMQIISCNLSQKLNSSKLGKAFNDLGFEKMRTKHSRGYRAIVRTAEEIKLTRYPSASTRRNAMMMLLLAVPKPSVHPVQGDRVTR